MPLFSEGQWLTIAWLIFAIILGVVEACTTQLVAIWFGIGALVAIVPSLLNASIWVQFFVFIGVSFLTLIATRPFVKKVIHVNHVRTNADSVIGKIGIVQQEINNDLEQGRVSVSGLDWAARSEVGEVFPVGEKVLIKAIHGVTLIVDRLI